MISVRELYQEKTERTGFRVSPGYKKLIRAIKEDERKKSWRIKHSSESEIVLKALKEYGQRNKLVEKEPK